jgi:hypothetical protein
VKRTRMTRRTAVVTGYEIDVSAVADAMLSDDWTRQLITGWVSRGGRSRAARPEHRID